MSFDVNVLSSKPVIKAAANMQNDGGAGNLGYMSQGRKHSEEHQGELNIFSQQTEIDTFSKSGVESQEKVEFSIKDFLIELFESILNIFK